MIGQIREMPTSRPIYRTKTCISPFPAWRQIDTIKAPFSLKIRLLNDQKAD